MEHHSFRWASSQDPTCLFKEKVDHILSLGVLDTTLYDKVSQ